MNKINPVPTSPEARPTLFGVPVDALDMDQTVSRVASLVKEGSGPHQHVVLNAAKVVEMQRNPALKAIIESCSVINADGTSIVWASKLLGSPLPGRVTGIDLFARLVAEAEKSGKSIFLLGAEQSVVEEVERTLKKRHPALVIAGIHNGFWTDDQEIVRAVRSCSPDYLFLAIPSPRKEFWLNEHLAELGVPLVMGVGGSFDVVAGKTSRAPMIFQRMGMEWFWRVLQEPRRLWKRYLFGNLNFMRIVAKDFLKKQRK
jgi:N-acetylglucosaminyldiphosphoundecaprenol N-acetyl-beta-D-mannosaminyltransferase